VLTAHQRIAIRTRLPEVERVSVRDDRGELDIAWIRLELADGSTIVIYGLLEDVCRCRRTRFVDVCGDRSAIEPIPAEMQERLVAVFGQLRFDPA
jgi:hypothetical protein